MLCLGYTVLCRLQDDDQDQHAVEEPGCVTRKQQRREWGQVTHDLDEGEVGRVAGGSPSLHRPAHRAVVLLPDSKKQSRTSRTIAATCRPGAGLRGRAAAEGRSVWLRRGVPGVGGRLGSGRRRRRRRHRRPLLRRSVIRPVVRSGLWGLQEEESGPGLAVCSYQEGRVGPHHAVQTKWPATEDWYSVGE